MKKHFSESDVDEETPVKQIAEATVSPKPVQNLPESVPASTQQTFELLHKSVEGLTSSTQALTECVTAMSELMREVLGQVRDNKRNETRLETL